MPRSKNAEAAAEMYRDQIALHAYGTSEAWKPIATLLLCSGLWVNSQVGWQTGNDAVYYREANDFRPGSIVVSRGSALADFLAKEIGFNRADLSKNIGLYWADKRFQLKQPHNLVGHAFRSMLVEALTLFGDPGIEYAEEVDPQLEFPGHTFGNRSKRARIDVVARRSGRPVALISSRWRFRHDRVDLVEEALAYIQPATRVNAHCKQYAWVGEFSPPRLEKVLQFTDGQRPNAPIAACVHFEPRLISEGLGERVLAGQLRSLAWLVQETFNWK